MYHLKDILIQFPKLALTWLNSWPAGLKLNTELSQFYCHSLLGVVVVWGGEILVRVPKFFLIGLRGLGVVHTPSSAKYPVHSRRTRVLRLDCSGIALQ